MPVNMREKAGQPGRVFNGREGQGQETGVVDGQEIDRV